MMIWSICRTNCRVATDLRRHNAHVTSFFKKWIACPLLCVRSFQTWWIVRSQWNQGPPQYIDCLSRYGDFHYKDKTVVRLSYLYNGNRHTGKTTSLYWQLSWCAVSGCSSGCRHDKLTTKHNNNGFQYSTDGVAWPHLVLLMMRSILLLLVGRVWAVVVAVGWPRIILAVKTQGVSFIYYFSTCRWNHLICMSLKYITLVPVCEISSLVCLFNIFTLVHVCKISSLVHDVSLIYHFSTCMWTHLIGMSLWYIYSL